MKTHIQSKRYDTTKQFLLGGVMLLGFAIINILLISDGIIGLKTKQGSSWANQLNHAISEEDDTLELIREGLAPKTPDILTFRLPNLDLFNNDNWISRKLAPAPARKMKTDSEAQYNPVSAQPDAARHELRDFVIQEAADCREFINYNTPTLGEWDEAKLDAEADRCHETIIDAVGGFRKHCFTYEISRYTTKEVYTGNSNRIRIRTTFNYTDLELLCHLFRTDSAEHECYGVEGAAQITPSMYAAYRLCIQIVEKAKRRIETKYANATPAERNYELASLLHDYLCSNCEYSGLCAAEQNRFLVTRTILSKTASSEGYARTYRLLLTMAGIPNEYVYGKVSYTAPNGQIKQAPRCWNLVSADGEHWFHVDVAADDPQPGADSHYSHAYFGMPAALFARSHTMTCIAPPLGSAPKEFAQAQDAWHLTRKQPAALSLETLTAAIVTRLTEGVFDNEFVYQGEPFTPAALTDAIDVYLSSKGYTFEKPIGLDVDQQPLSPNCYIVRIVLRSDQN